MKKFVIELVLVVTGAIIGLCLILLYIELDKKQGWGNLWSLIPMWFFIALFIQPAIKYWWKKWEEIKKLIQE